jgi:hypothetical protein
MQVRAINLKGKKLSQAKMQALVSRLERAIDRAGFETTVFQVNSSRIDIKGGSSGVSNKYATVNVEKRGYNFRVNSYTAYHTKLGYKRTNVLSWDQRVELNRLINAVLDGMKLSATIASRGFVVRDRITGAVTSWDVPFESNLGDSFQPNFHDWIYSNEFQALQAVRDAFPERRVHVDLSHRKPVLTVVMGGVK